MEITSVATGVARVMLELVDEDEFVVLEEVEDEPEELVVDPEES